MVGFVLGFVFLVAVLVIIGLYIATSLKMIIFVVHVIVYIFSADRNQFVSVHERAGSYSRCGKKVPRSGPGQSSGTSSGQG